MITDGKVLKALSKTDDELRVGNYMALFGGRDLQGVITGSNPDGSMGEHFTPQTDFESAYTRSGKLDIDWEHGLGQELDGKDAPGKDDVMGYVDWKTAKVDKRGLWVERVLDRRNWYMKYVEVLIDAGMIANSSQAFLPGVETTKSGEIRKWPLMRDTLTVMPMEPRMMTDNLLSAVKALQITPEGAPDDEYISVEEGKALQARARKMLVDDAVMDHFWNTPFERKPSEEEELYSDAAKAMVFLYANTRIKSLSVRVTDYMPDGRYDGVKLAGHFAGNEQGEQRILIGSHNGKLREFNVFCHELGHLIDYLNSGKSFKSLPTEVWEEKAWEWASLLKSAAFGWANRLYYGNKRSTRHISVDNLLKAMASIKE